MKFLPYQVKWIQDESPIKLYEKTRRGGITYATSYRACLKCLRSGKKDSTFVQWVTSRDEITAKEFVTDYVARWAKEANKAARKVAEQWEGVIGLDGKNIEVVDEKRGITAMVVKFKNGARIYSLSSNPMAFAGKGGDVLIDEWDLRDDQATIWDMAFPCITWGGQLEAVSAYDPEGSEDTEFAKLCAACRNGLKPNISFHRTTLVDAVNQGLVEAINEVRQARGQKPQTREEFLEHIRGGCRTKGAYESQYMCIPNKASGGQMIDPDDLIASKKKLDVMWIDIEGMEQLERKRDLFEPAFWARIFGQDRYALGWDIAATGDMTSIFVNRLGTGPVDSNGFSDAVKWGKPHHEQVALITMHKCDRLTRQREIIDAMMSSTWNIVGCGDKSGLGLSDCTELEIKYRIDDKHSRFVGVSFSALKLVLGTTMQAAYEQHRQDIPIDIPEIAADVASIKKDKTDKRRKLTFTEGKNELLPNSHADVGWSNALSIYAAETINNFGPCRFEPSTAESNADARRNNFNNPNRMKRHEISEESVWPI